MHFIAVLVHIMSTGNLTIHAKTTCWSKAHMKNRKPPCWTHSVMVKLLCNNITTPLKKTKHQCYIYHRHRGHYTWSRDADLTPDITTCHLSGSNHHHRLQRYCFTPVTILSSSRLHPLKRFTLTLKREECISYEPIYLLSSLIVFNHRCTQNVCFTPALVHSGAVFDINRILLFSAQPSAADSPNCRVFSFA